MVLAIIQARLGSTRFPRKVLAKMNDGRTVLAHVMERANLIRGVDRVRVAWPFIYDGDENDVLGRFAHVATWTPEADTIMRLTADCPLLDPDVCARVLDLYRAADCQYAWTDTSKGDWPDGLDCEVFSRQLLGQCADVASDPADREHVTSWMRRGNAMTVSLRPDPAYAGWPKLSIDTPEDLERVRNWRKPTARSISYSRSQ